MSAGFVLYVTRPGPTPAGTPGRLYAELEYLVQPALALGRLLYAVERSTTRRGTRGWPPPVDDPAWELWRTGPVPTPLAASSGQQVACHPPLRDLLAPRGGPDALYRHWAHLYRQATGRAPSITLADASPERHHRHVQ